MKNHPSTQAFVTSNKNLIEKYIKQYSGDINAFVNQDWFKDDMFGVPRPMFNTDFDMFTGLKIAINDTWGYAIDLKNYTSDGKTYRGTIKYTIYDHFGLDDEDAAKFGWHSGFIAWYILQHHVDVKENYKPFVTYIEIEEPIRGNI